MIAIDAHAHALRRIAVFFVLAASSAALWGSLAGLPFVAVLTFVNVFLRAWPIKKAKESILLEVKEAFLYGGTWAAWGMISTYRLGN
jgi:hypothetical protein